ncbi:MAG: glycosyltransferase [Phycisphaerales bacterium]|nr:glycosyltransferase [Phycisphaerales bacterium]
MSRDSATIELPPVRVAARSPAQTQVGTKHAVDGPVAERVSPALSIILATYNERDNILDTIRSVFEHVGDDVEVIVVDDDSPDETWKLVQALEDPRVVLIRRVATRGLASAFNRGIIESRGRVVGWMDADMCMPPALLPEMIAALDSCDICIGSRYAPGGADDRTRLRVRCSRMINGLARVVLGGGIRDYDSGFVVLRRSVFDKVSVIPTGYGAYFMEFLYTCRRKGLCISEVPYRFTDRRHGQSKSAPNVFKFAWTGCGYVTRILTARLRRID